MNPQAELERLNSNRLKSRKEVRSFQYKLKVDLIQSDSKQIEVETSLCACYFVWSVIIPVAQVMGVSLNRRPNCTGERKQDQRPKTQNRNIARYTLRGVEIHVIDRVLVCRKSCDQTTKPRPSRECFFRPRNT